MCMDVYRKKNGFTVVVDHKRDNLIALYSYGLYSYGSPWWLTINETNSSPLMNPLSSAST